MHILVTGAAGRVGSYTVKYLLARDYNVTALDVIPLPAPILATFPPSHTTLLQTAVCDLTDFNAFETILRAANPPIEGVIHHGSIPDLLTLDPRIVHNNNVTGSYNVMQTAASLGIKKIVQASSVNATGLSYSPPGHHRYDDIPVTEDTPMRPEDSYATSKQICEVQASALVRLYPDVRVASLRFHQVRHTYAEAVKGARVQDGFAWTSFDAAASASLLGIISTGWQGHEVFNITAPESSWEGGPNGDSKSDTVLDKKVGTLELMEVNMKGRYGKVREEWWDGWPRRSIWDATKAERLMGWNHDQS